MILNVKIAAFLNMSIPRYNFTKEMQKKIILKLLMKKQLFLIKGRDRLRGRLKLHLVEEIQLIRRYLAVVLSMRVML